MKKKFGWKPDLPDHRDMPYAAPLHIVKALPEKIDLRSKCPAVYDQGQLGSCTANALAANFQFDKRLQKIQAVKPSRLFIYYNERAMEGSIDYDAGAYIRDGIKSMARDGVPAETLWPYKISKFTVKPSKKSYDTALTSQVSSYMRIDNSNLVLLKGCLADGFPFVFGFTVFDSFMSSAVAKNGIMPMPTTQEQVQGGHAVMAVGYDDAKGQFICRNSWGTSWGEKGYFFMPYAYITNTNLCDDFWTIRLVE